jgi:hypothetical protein
MSTVIVGITLRAMVPLPALAQAATDEPRDFWQKSLVDREVANAFCWGAETPESVSLHRTPRIRLFGMLPGFLSDPQFLSLGDDLADVGPTAGSESGNGLKGMVVSFGDDNPFFDPRRPGDPGGVGYVRLHYQVQVVESGRTSVCLGLEGWAPAGLEAGGVADGPTIFSPGLGVFYDLGDGMGLQGYVGQHFHGRYHQGPLRCGMGMHCPLLWWQETEDAGVFFFVQAMGRYTYEGDRRGMSWDVVPGLHWRISDNFWMSVGASRYSTLTWGWQY